MEQFLVNASLTRKRRFARPACNIQPQATGTPIDFGESAASLGTPVSPAFIVSIPERKSTHFHPSQTSLENPADDLSRSAVESCHQTPLFRLFTIQFQFVDFATLFPPMVYGIINDCRQWIT
jgi:hypothetical protein